VIASDCLLIASDCRLVARSPRENSPSCAALGAVLGAVPSAVIASDHCLSLPLIPLMMTSDWHRCPRACCHRCFAGCSGAKRSL